MYNAIIIGLIGTSQNGLLWYAYTPLLFKVCEPILVFPMNDCYSFRHILQVGMKNSYIIDFHT